MGKLESNFKSSSQKLSQCHVGQEPAPGEPVQASSHSVPKHASLAAKPIGHLKLVFSHCEGRGHQGQHRDGAAEGWGNLNQISRALVRS